ncbi:chromate transporter [Neobacillus mesonae]|nr:chromate transporter [Neobacillus mesonae]
MIPLIEQAVIDKKKWFTESELADMMSMAGSAPGGVGVNAAAFVGYRKAGIGGAAAAVIGITLPAFIIVVMMSLVYFFFKDEPKVEAALKGIRAAVIALILMAAYRMSKVSVFDKATRGVLIFTVGILLLVDIHPLYFIMFGLFVGFVIVRAKEKMGIKVRTEDLERPKGSSGQLEPEYYI